MDLIINPRAWGLWIGVRRAESTGSGAPSIFARWPSMDWRLCVLLIDLDLNCTHSQTNTLTHTPNSIHTRSIKQQGERERKNPLKATNTDEINLCLGYVCSGCWRWWSMTLECVQRPTDRRRVGRLGYWILFHHFSKTKKTSTSTAILGESHWIHPFIHVHSPAQEQQHEKEEEYSQKKSKKTNNLLANWIAGFTRIR